MKTVFFTGGHHTSALILARDLKKLGHRIVWLGHKYTMKAITNPSLEWREVSEAGIEFINLKTGKIHKGGLREWFWLTLGFFQSLSLILKLKPALIVSFGGYLAVPVVLSGSLLGISSVTHEQTVGAGLANRFLKHFVKFVFITWPESGKYFPKEKTILVGLPLRKEILKPEKRVFFKNKKPMILVAGGKQGSHIINQAVAKILPQLLEKFNLLHQVGETSTFSDLKTLSKTRLNLPASLQSNYKVTAYLNSQQMGAALNQAECLICRSGAHTLYELLALGKRAVLIPLPFSYADEQRKNAQKLADLGLAIVIEQKDLTPERLLEAVGKQMKIKTGQRKALKAKAKKQVIFTARERILDRLIKLLD